LIGIAPEIVNLWCNPQAGFEAINHHIFFCSILAGICRTAGLWSVDHRFGQPSEDRKEKKQGWWLSFL